MITNRSALGQVRIRRGLVFGMIITAALFAFEIFNYSTTEYALSDLLGEMDFAGLRWATILAIAFCGIDFAGIARLFTPSLNNSDPDSGVNESWYLFGAWLLAATMNAMLTWWGISLAVMGHQTLGNDVVSRATLLRIVPIFVSVLVWLIRVLIIGTFSVAGDRLFIQDQSRDDLRVLTNTRTLQPTRVIPEPAANNRRAPALRPANSSSVVRSPRSTAPASHNQPETYPGNRQEPTYHPLSANSTNPNTARAGAARVGGRFRGSDHQNNGR